MPDKPPGRVRFVECVIEPSAKGVRARCVLADASGASFTGNAQGERHHDPELWYGAEATVDALRQTLEVTAQDLKLRDVVAFEIGDHPAVAVELRVLVDGHKRKLHGLCQAEADRSRAVALAVLAATNRFFSQG